MTTKIYIYGSNIIIDKNIFFLINIFRCWDNRYTDSVSVGTRDKCVTVVNECPNKIVTVGNPWRNINKHLLKPDKLSRCSSRSCRPLKLDSSRLKGNNSFILELTGLVFLTTGKKTSILLPVWENTTLRADVGDKSGLQSTRCQHRLEIRRDYLPTAL